MQNILAKYDRNIIGQNISAKRPIAFGGFWQMLQIKSSQNPQDEILAQHMSAKHKRKR